MVYRSKVDAWFYFIVIGMCILMGNSLIQVCLTKSVGAIIFTAIITLSVITLLLGILFRTYYVFEEDGIRIRCFIFCNVVIPYKSIISVKPTYNPVSSSALSLDRLEVKFMRPNHRPDIALISPIHRDDFIKEVQQRQTMLQKERS
ncbi:MAG: PH domain-containing protein [Turicibacter sp.]|nr:PH domain-containing protein [Turicibacter sp.]